MKGQISETLVKLMALLFAAVVLFSVVGIVYVKNLRESGNVEVCRTSFIAASKASVGPKKYLDIECSPRTIKISKKDAPYEDAMLFKISEEMKRCNYMTVEGKVDPFSQNILSNGVACVICSRVEVLDDAVGVSSDKILNYMKETLMGDESYFDYIYGSRTFYGVHFGEGNPFDKKPVVSGISPGKNYYIVYQHFSNAYVKKWIPIVDDNFYSSILLIPIDKIGNGGYRCDYLAS